MRGIVGKCITSFADVNEVKSLVEYTACNISFNRKGVIHFWLRESESESDGLCPRSYTAISDLTHWVSCL